MLVILCKSKFGASNLRNLADDNNYNRTNQSSYKIEGGYFMVVLTVQEHSGTNR